MNPASLSTFRSRPWGWIPSLYIAEGLPYFAVNVLTVIMYTNMGISASKMAFYTGLLYLPWVIKPFWSPFVDLIKTKRWWTLSMQFLIFIALGLVAFSLQTVNFFTISLIIFWLLAFFSATHDIAADGYYMMALDQKNQAAFVGVRSTFYRIASILGQGGIVMIAGYFEEKYSDIPHAWTLTFSIVSGFFLLIFLWDCLNMPVAPDDKPLEGVTSRKIIKDFANTFVTFFSKRNVWLAIVFMLLYRLPEALCLKLVQPFLLDSKIRGGLGLTTTDVGFINGTLGVVCLLLGGILGGIMIARGGLKKWLWPMALSLSLPCIIYLIFAILQPESYMIISIGLGIEQFGYGFGFTAYMLYMMYFSAGECQTSHYAFCTAFMALGMMLPGMAAGWIYNFFETFTLQSLSSENPGYVIFFCFVMVTCIATYVSVLLIKPSLKK